MKSRSLVVVFFALFIARAVFAGPVTNCLSGSNVGDGSGGYITRFDCNFYHEAVYPFDLTSFITFGNASLAENELVPGYVVWTTNVSDYNNQTLLVPGAFQDVLDFDANLGGLFSSQVYVDWSAGQGGPGFPSVATMQAAGYLVLAYDSSGVELFDPSDGNHTFTVDDNLPGAVPEPSTLLLVLAGGLGTLIVRRRRCQRPG